MFYMLMSLSGLIRSSNTPNKVIQIFRQHLIPVVIFSRLVRLDDRRLILLCSVDNRHSQNAYPGVGELSS